MISLNNALTNLIGLDNVVSIGFSYPWMPETSLAIVSNNALASLTGLQNVISIAGPLYITDNNALLNLSGIDNINPTSITNMSIHNNASLSKCEVLSICNYLANPNGTTYIYDNATGCNSQEEVQDSCEANAVNIDEQFIADKLVIYPNPAHSTITIELPAQPSKNTTLTISNTNGQQLITQPITNPQTEIDISHLPVGIYIVKVWNDEDVMVRKVIKE